MTELTRGNVFDFLLEQVSEKSTVIVLRHRVSPNVHKTLCLTELTRGNVFDFLLEQVFEKSAVNVLRHRVRQTFKMSLEDYFRKADQLLFVVKFANYVITKSSNGMKSWGNLGFKLYSIDLRLSKNQIVPFVGNRNI